VANILQPADIVEIGIEKEKKRRDFYALAAGRFKDKKELAELFEKLRDWEEQHIEKFQQIRENLRKAQYTESYPGETEGYMQALVDSELYNMITPDRFEEIVKTEFDALDIGIGFEKDAILFFGSLAGYLDVGDREVVEKLVDEEKQHMLFLFNLKKELQG